MGDDWNSDDVDKRDHERLLAGEPTASVDVFARLFQPLVRQLRFRFQMTDYQDIEDAASRALLDYLEHPERFDDSKSSLSTYLHMIGGRDLLNILSPKSRISEHEAQLDPVEFDKVARNNNLGGDDPTTLFLLAERDSELQIRFMECVQSEEERIAMQLMIEGERSTEVFAEALGWNDLPNAERRKRVNRLKDRLMKRLQRHIELPDD